MPHRVVAVPGLDPGDGDHAAAVLDPAGVAHLAPTAGMERRAIEPDSPRTGVDDAGFVLDEVGLLVAEVDGHAPNATEHVEPARPRTAVAIAAYS